MKETQEYNPVNGSISTIEKFVSNSSQDVFCLPDYSQLIVEKMTIDRNILAKSVIFECEKCGGPLVPKSKCDVCKRTSERICVKCNFSKEVYIHDACKYLDSMNIKYRRQIHRVKKEANN